MLLLCLVAALLAKPFLSLMIGILGSLLFRWSIPISRAKLPGTLLQAGVLVLGLTFSAQELVTQGDQWLLPVACSITATLGLGLLIGRALGMESPPITLMSSGTAICGGTAIAAIAPVIRSDPHHTAEALAIVFIMNGVALLVFPAVGQWLELTPQDFGLWCGLAIHDTASVVGAASTMGAESLQTATTVKLLRTLALIPLVFGLSLGALRSIRAMPMPRFVVAFLMASIVGSVIEIPTPLVTAAHVLSKSLFCAALALMGLSISPQVIRKIQPRLLVLATTLWAAISMGSLGWIVLQ